MAQETQKTDEQVTRERKARLDKMFEGRHDKVLQNAREERMKKIVQKLRK
jgi:hypothetical protein